MGQFWEEERIESIRNIAAQSDNYIGTIDLMEQS